MPKSLGNIYSQDVPTVRPGTSLYEVLQLFHDILTEYTEHYWALIIKKNVFLQPMVFIDDSAVLLQITKSRGRHYEMFCDIFFYSLISM